MGPQPASLPRTGASRRAHRSPSANKTKAAWCRLPPQLLSRSSYAWFWPSFHWKLRTHSAARFLAAPETETRFPCLQTSSGPRNAGNRVQVQGKGPEIPRRAIFLATATASGRDGDSLDSGLAGGGDYRRGVWIICCRCLGRKGTGGVDEGARQSEVVGPWHDNRHTLVTELIESGAGDEAIMSITGHVSRAMLSRHPHLWMEAKRRALDEIAAQQRAADEKRKEGEMRQQETAVSQSVLVQ